MTRADNEFEEMGRHNPNDNDDDGNEKPNE